MSSPLSDWRGAEILSRFLECGVLAYGFAHARGDDGGHDFLIACSGKGRGVCPSGNPRRIAQTAAHLADHVLLIKAWRRGGQEQRMLIHTEIEGRPAA